MKSRTSFFNLTVFKKDITRFAPCWGLYTLMLLLMLLGISSYDNPYYRASDAAAFCESMSIVSLCYGLVTAQLLFGDLYNPRLCNALHAMPLRRGTWFLTHTLSGLAFSFIPNVFVSLLGLAMLRLGVGWSVVFWWLLAATLQYLFFFGLAVLCTMLSGNRFAQIVVYGILNIASLLVYLLVAALYEPMLYGIQLDSDAFCRFCPIFWMMDNQNLVNVLYERIHERVDDQLGIFSHYELLGIAIGEGWGYLVVCALIGAAFVGLALVLYRKRKLECAGDFLAFRGAELVFLVTITVFAGFFSFLFSVVFDIYGTPLFLGFGMAVGFFGGLMLLRRTTRVFSRKAFGTLGLIAGVFVVSVIANALDPIGITRHVPDLSDVKSVTVSNSTYLHFHGDHPFIVEDPEDIQAILGVHQDAIDGNITNYSGDESEHNYMVDIQLEYQLKNGVLMNRFYSVSTDSEAGQTLKKYFSSTECVLRIREEEIPQLAEKIDFISSGSEPDDFDIRDLDIEGLLYAIAADCEAGNMAQIRDYHCTSDGTDSIRHFRAGYLELGQLGEEGKSDTEYYAFLDIYDDCENTLRWMEENGFH